MNFNFCPNCGKPSLSQKDKTHYACSECGQDIYNNPKATVAVVFLRNGEVLFSKRGIDPHKGKYDFPGGFIEYGEDPYDACIREIQEETGVHLARNDLTLLAAYTGEYIPHVSVTDLVFVATEWQGDFAPADDSAALEWKPVSFIDSDDFIPPHTDLVTKLQNFA